MSTIDLRTAIKTDPSYVPQLKRKSMDVDGTTRFFRFFIGKVYLVANPVVYLFAPNGADIATFVESSG